jgi:hypothetical protein
MRSTGLKGLVICNAPGTADTPRAHVVNPFAIGESVLLLAYYLGHWAIG